MEILSSIDSISIQIINIDYHKSLFRDFYSDNKLHNNRIENQRNVEVVVYRFFERNETQLSLFYTSHCGSRHNPTTYTSFNFNGLKSYHENKDLKRTNILSKFIVFVTSHKIEFKLKKLDIDFDIKIQKKSIENFLPIRIGKKTGINDPLNFYTPPLSICNPRDKFGCTLYVESKDIAKPSVRSYLYDKAFKEGLPYQLFRFEICIAKMQKTNNDFENVVKHIKSCVSKYRLFYISSIAKCNDIKRIYRENIKNPKKENFPITLQKKIRKIHAVEITLEINGSTIDILRRLLVHEKDEECGQDSVGFFNNLEVLLSLSSTGSPRKLVTQPMKK